MATNIKTADNGGSVELLFNEMSAPVTLSGSLTVNGEIVYNGEVLGSGGTDVTVTPIATTGTDIAVITIDGTPVTLKSGTAQVAVFSTSANGLVPKPSSASATLFLTAAGTWATTGGVNVGTVGTLSTVSSTYAGAIWLA